LDNSLGYWRIGRRVAWCRRCTDPVVEWPAQGSEASGSNRRRFIKSSLAAGAGTTASFAMLGPVPTPLPSPPASPTPNGRSSAGKVSTCRPKHSTAPWKNIRAVIEKQVIDCHCHPYETRLQSSDSVAEQAQHAHDDWVDFSDQMIASMDHFGIGLAVCNPAFETYEKRRATCLRASCGPAVALVRVT
jgi:hypothetical protein